MTDILHKIFRTLIAVYVFTLFYLWWQPVPETPEPLVYRISPAAATFFGDTTYYNDKGERVVSQTVWDEIFRLVAGARGYALVDIGQLNDWQSLAENSAHPLAHEFVDHMILGKESYPTSTRIVIVDPLNTLYGGAPNAELERLENGGVTLRFTDTRRLYDADLFYGAFWRAFLQWFGNSQGGYLPHPLDHDGPDVSLRSWLEFLTMRMNERAIIVADENDKTDSSGHKIVLFLTSRGATDRGSADISSGLSVRGKLWIEALALERETAAKNGEALPMNVRGDANEEEGDLAASYLREGKVHLSLLGLLERARSGDNIVIAWERLGDREVVDAIIRAENRGVSLQVLLDPNEHWMGYAQNGLPNSPVAVELLGKSTGKLQVRYCAVRHEACRPNFAFGTIGDKHFLLVGSGDLTRRDLRNFNLATAILLEHDTGSFPAYKEAEAFFNKLWVPAGEDGASGVAGPKNAWWHASLYRFIERTGLSVF